MLTDLYGVRPSLPRRFVLPLGYAYVSKGTCPVCRQHQRLWDTRQDVLRDARAPKRPILPDPLRPSALVEPHFDTSFLHTVYIKHRKREVLSWRERAHLELAIWCCAPRKLFPSGIHNPQDPLLPLYGCRCAYVADIRGSLRMSAKEAAEATAAMATARVVPGICVPSSHGSSQPSVVAPPLSLDEGADFSETLSALFDRETCSPSKWQRQERQEPPSGAGQIVTTRSDEDASELNVARPVSESGVILSTEKGGLVIPDLELPREEGMKVPGTTWAVGKAAVASDPSSGNKFRFPLMSAIHAYWQPFYGSNQLREPGIALHETSFGALPGSATGAPSRFAYLRTAISSIVGSKGFSVLGALVTRATELLAAVF